MTELKAPMSLRRCSTSSMPRSRSSTSALTMLISSSSALASRPAAKLAVISFVFLPATSPR